MINKFLDFVRVSPTQYQACENAQNMLNEAGFEKLNESSKWNLVMGGKYYITRNNSSVIAFTVPTDLSNLSFNNFMAISILFCFINSSTCISQIFLSKEYSSKILIILSSSPFNLYI